MKPVITVIGSSNTDMVIQSSKLPAPGETIIGGKFLMNPGGKGANQAVAAARLGGSVTFVAKTGNDVFGKQAIQLFQKEGIATDFMITDDDNPSGVALIMVDNKGENCISVALGSNGTLNGQDIDKAKSRIEASPILLMQLEIPLSTVEYVAGLAEKGKNKIILNPAPAQKLSNELLQSIYLLTPNTSEAEILTGMKVKNTGSVQKAAIALKERGVENVIITLGAEGAYVLADGISEMVPAPVVRAIDTTAAGDTFNGAIAVAIGEGAGIIEAVKFANHAASISVTRMGAQVSIPFRKEL